MTPSAWRQTVLARRASSSLTSASATAHERMLLTDHVVSGEATSAAASADAAGLIRAGAGR